MKDKEGILRRDPLEKTPVFLPGESHGQRSLVGYCPSFHSWTQLSNKHFDFPFPN